MAGISFRVFADRLAERRARRHRSTRGSTRFVVVTGSQGKTTAARMAHCLLAGDGPALLSAFWNTSRMTRERLFKVRRGDRYAVFELAENSTGGTDHLGESLSLLRPDVALITLIANDHYSEFRSREAAAAKISAAVRAVPADGLVVLNADDPLVLAMRDEAKGRVVTYGEAASADYRAENVIQGGDGVLRFDCIHGGEAVRFEIGLVGRHFIASILGAIAVAAECGVPLAELAKRASEFEMAPGRCSLHRAADGTLVIADTNKAVYDTLGASFTVLDAFPSAPRRTAIIGTISDYSGSARPKYRDAYNAAREHADRVIMFGQNAMRARPLPEDVANGRFMATESFAELRSWLRETAVPNEVILLKGSIVDHLERIALAAEAPVTCALERCKRRDSCFSCDLLRNPAPKPVRFVRRRLKKLRLRWSRDPEFR